MSKISHTRKIIFVVLFLIIGCPFFASGKIPTSDRQLLLATILKNSARYCERLKEAVFHFFCLEKVTEKIEKKLHYPENRRGLKDFLEGNTSTRPADYQYEAHRNVAMRRLRDNFKKMKGGMKTFFTYDYQIIQVGKKTEEQRILQKVEKDKKVYQKSSYHPILYSYKNAMVPIHFFSAENQAQYKYTLGSKKRVLKREAYNVLVYPITEGSDVSPLASVWIDQEDFSILKFVVFPGAIKGYHQLLRVNSDKLSKINIVDVHEFGLLKQGIRYPTKTKINLSYQNEMVKVMENRSSRTGVRIGAIVSTKIETLIRYTDYRFFKVNVARPIFKKDQ